MPNFAALLAPLVFLAPLAAVPDEAGRTADESASAKLTAVPAGEEAPSSHEWLSLDSVAEEPREYQIRIEQRVVIRVSPYRPASRSNLNATAPRAPSKPRKLEERKIGKCIKVKSIGAVQPSSDNRLLLYMRDQRLIAASLEKACSARDFYQGFYVEPRKDGNLCVERDKLQSRTGAKCELTRIRQLVAETS